MRVSQKADYALRAMLDLALHSSQPGALHSADIARRQKIPEKFLELILVELRRAHLVSSQRGSGGGHRLARAPSEISVGEIWRAIDGTSPPPVKGAPTGADPFASVWDEADRAVDRVVNGVSLAEICERVKFGREVADFNI